MVSPIGLARAIPADRARDLGLFAGTLVGIGGLLIGAAAGRTWTPRLTRTQWRLVAFGAGTAILLSWALKVFVLGN